MLSIIRRMRTRLPTCLSMGLGAFVAMVDSQFGTYGISRRRSASVRLDVGRPDHLAPFLGFLGDEPSEVGGRAGKHRATQDGEPRFYLGVGEARIDLLVEFVDELGRRVLRRSYASPGTYLEARYKITDRWEV